MSTGPVSSSRCQASAARWCSIITIPPLHPFNSSKEQSQVIYYSKETRSTFWGKRMLVDQDSWKRLDWCGSAGLKHQSHTFSLQTSSPGSNSTIASPRFSLGKHLTVNMNEQQREDSLHLFPFTVRPLMVGPALWAQAPETRSES